MIATRDSLPREDAPARERARPTGTAHRRRSRSLLVWAALALLLAAFLLPVAYDRIPDGDEGFYVIAAELVGRGFEPYEDFWFQHGPLLPYVYGAWIRLFGESWFAVRTLSALLTASIGVLLFRHVAARFGSRRLGLVAAALFIGCTWTFQWYVTVKSYALSVLLLFVAYVCVAAVDQVDGKRVAPSRWLIAGVFAGLAIDVRLLFAPVIVVFAWYAGRTMVERAERIRQIAYLLAGCLVGLAPTLYFFGIGPRRFLADTLESQTTRSSAGLSESIPQRLRTIGEVFATLQFGILVIASVAVLIVCLTRRTRVPLAIAIAAALCAVSLAPTPSYTQYFVTMVPFLSVGAVSLIHMLRTSQRSGSASDYTAPLSIATAAVMAMYLLVGVTGIDTTREWKKVFPTLQGVRDVAEAVDGMTAPGEVVMSFGPGYLFETQARPYPGMESNFAARVAEAAEMSESRARAFKILTTRGIEQALRDRRARVVVGPPTRWIPILESAGYAEVAVVDGVGIYARR